MGSGRVVRSRKTVRQRGYTPPTGDAIYANDFDKEQATKTYGSKGESWPYLDQFNGWENHSGTGADAVTYSYNGMSARANSTSNSDYSDYEGSGANNLFFGASAVFTIEKISIGARNLKLSFGAERYSQDAGSDFIHDDFRVQLSNDGSAWSSPIIYSFAKGVDPSGRWDLATADFTLPENTTTLYIRFTSNVDSAHRLDDVTLAEGVGGQQISFDGDTPTPGETVTTTIPELIALCEAAGSTQKVINETKDYCFEAVVVTDKEGGNFNGQNLQVMTPGATTAKNGITLYGSGKYTDPYDDGFTFVKGDKVKVTLKKGEARIVSYNGLYEVTGSKGADWVEIEKIGTETITPVVVDPAKLAEYQGMVVAVKGVTAPATPADWTTNEAFGKHTFTTSAGNMTVFVQKAMPGLVGTQFVAGSTGDITGYASVNSNAAQVCPQRPEDVAAFMGEPSTDPAITKLDPMSLSFAATDNAKTVTVTAANADDCTIEAATDKSEQFTTSVKGMVVTVTPKENTTEQAITATLTIKLMKAGAAVDTKTVAISQAGKIVGSGYVRVTSITSGKKYLIVAENGDKYAVLPASAGLNASKLFDGIAITVANGKIEANAANNAHAVTIVASDGAYTIQNTAGKFIEYANNSSGKTQLAIVDASSRKWVADEETAGTFLIKDSEVTGRALLYRNGDTEYDNRFGGYATSNIGKGYITVALYELSE